MSFPSSQKREACSAEQIHRHMICSRPCHGIKKLGREDRPDEQMGPQGCTRRHDGNERGCDLERQQRGGAVVLRGLGRLDEMAHRHPPDWPGPVAHKRQHSHQHHAIAADSIICA